MNILQAKNEIKNTVQAYLSRIALVNMKLNLRIKDLYC